VRFGGNARLDNLQAAIMRVKLRHYDKALKTRRRLARLYNEQLSSCEALLLPPAPDSDPDRYDIYQNYEIQAEDRDQLRQHLVDDGIGTIVQWGGYMVHQFEELKLKYNAPYAEEMSRRYMLLPMHHLLSEEQVIQICKSIREFYKSSKNSSAF